MCVNYGGLNFFSNLTLCMKLPTFLVQKMYTGKESLLDLNHLANFVKKFSIFTHFYQKFKIYIYVIIVLTFDEKWILKKSDKNCRIRCGSFSARVALLFTNRRRKTVSHIE